MSLHVCTGPITSAVTLAGSCLAVYQKVTSISIAPGGGAKEKLVYLVWELGFKAKLLPCTD